MQKEIYKRHWKSKHFLESFKNARQGLLHILRIHRNARAIFLFGAFIIIYGFYLKITLSEMLIVLVMICLVFVTEIFNTMLEDIANLITHEFNPVIKIIKDMSAAAVLVASLISVVVG